MEFLLEMMGFILKMMDFILKTTDFSFLFILGTPQVGSDDSMDQGKGSGGWLTSSYDNLKAFSAVCERFLIKWPFSPECSANSERM